MSGEDNLLSVPCFPNRWFSWRSVETADHSVFVYSQLNFIRGITGFLKSLINCYRDWYPDWGHCGVTVYPKKYAHCFCFAVLCCGYTLTDFPISTRLTSLALWQSNDCPSASKATLMNMDKYFMWIHYERLHNHNKAKHNKTVCIFLGIYCTPHLWISPRTEANDCRNWGMSFIMMIKI